jgi:acyl carrier protein
MTDELTAGIATIVSANFPRYKGEVTDDLEFPTVPGWDSVSHVAMLLDVEDHFGATIPEESYFDISTVALLKQAIKTAA